MPTSFRFSRFSGASPVSSRDLTSPLTSAGALTLAVRSPYGSASADLFVAVVVAVAAAAGVVAVASS